MDSVIGDQSKKKKFPSKNWTAKEIEDELKKFDEKIEDAKTNAGDVEVRDNILDKAIFLK